jgi:ferric-dicitrate binding protein FerR (iron transport regulator)
MKNITKTEIEMQNQIDDYSRLWEQSSKLSRFDRVDVEGDWKSVRKKMGFETKRKKIPLQKYFIRISAIIVVALGLTFFLAQVVKQVPGGQQADYFKAIAENEAKEVILPDGSMVTLNKNTSVFYNSNFGSQNRDIILEGEAFFEVQKNEQLPFKVFIANSTVEVLGTSFNVKSNDNEVHLSVVTGHVAFFETTNKNNRVELKKNEMVHFNARNKKFDDKITFQPNLIAWKTGKLEFRDVPMEEVFNTLAGYFGMELVLELNNQFNDSFTGSFKDQSLDEIVEYVKLTTTQSFMVEQRNNQLIITN